MAKRKSKKNEELEGELQELRHRLFEANETIEAIRLGQVDALILESPDGNQLYTLKTADQIYRIFIEKMAEGAVTLSTDGIILFCNSQFASMLKLSMADVLGKPFKEFILAENIAQFETLFQQSWSGEQKQELQLRAQAEVIPVQLSVSSLTIENQTVLSVIITDLTQQRAAREELERTNRLLGDTNKALENSNHDLQQFASVASHDLQEPLRKRQILLGYMLEKNPDAFTGKASQQMERVMQAATRIRSLVVDVLNYSRLSSDDDVMTTISIGEVVREVLDDLAFMIRDKGAAIEVGPLPVLQGNRGQLRQVIQNLIVNALKFSKPGEPPRIHISSQYLRTPLFDAATSPDGPYCLISVRDEGIGFDEIYAEKIFSLFTRLHSKDLYEGTGIGLAIVKRVVERHGGLVYVHSQKNFGTEFRLLFPVKQSEPSGLR